MIGMGTAINAGAIVAGGMAGLAFGRFLTPRFQETLIAACGACVVFIGLGGALEQAFAVDGPRLRLTGALMAAVCLAAGSLAGELLSIHAGLERLGAWLRERCGASGDRRFIDAFVTASLTVCIGAMAVIGSIEDALQGKCDILALKAVLDCIIVCIMTAAMGKGCIFSALPVALFQGSLTLLAVWIGPVLTPAMTSGIAYTGSILIFLIGVNLLWDRKIRVSNMLPALLFAVAWAAFLPQP